MAFEIHGLILALHYEARFLKTPGSIERANTGFAHIVARYGSHDADQNSSAVPGTVKTSSPTSSSTLSRPSSKASKD